jgi:tetratricopeptide (TPR) repeat protein
MKRLALFPSVFVVAFAVGCASSGVPPKGSVSPKSGGIDRKVVDKDELAALLNDNPTSLARRAKDGASDPNGEAVAKGDDGQGGGPEASAEEPAPPDPAPIMQKAQAALEAKDYANAQKYAQQVIDMDPKGYPYAYVILGDVALEQKKYEQALAYYKKAIELDPKDGWAAQRAAQVLDKMGKKAEARGILRKHVMANDKVDADTWDALACDDRGASRRSEGDREGAHRALRSRARAPPRHRARSDVLPHAHPRQRRGAVLREEDGRRQGRRREEEEG